MKPDKNDYKKVKKRPNKTSNSSSFSEFIVRINTTQMNSVEFLLHSAFVGNELLITLLKTSKPSSRKIRLLLKKTEEPVFM